MPILFRDYETRSKLDLKNVGAWRYASAPDTGIWCIAYAVDDDPVQLWIPDQPVPEEFHAAAHDSDWLIVAHNDAFERAIEQHILETRYGWPIVPIERHACTMAATLASALPAKLDTVAEVLDLQIRKDAQGARLMRLMSRPRKPRAGEDPNGIYWHDDPEKLERLYAYCRNDVEVERELFRRLPPLADSEQALWVLDATINQRGFHTDGPLLEAASRIAAAAGQAVQEELTKITAGALTSTDQVAALLAWLGEHGCEVKNLRKPTLKHALRRKELDPIARRAIELRLGAAHAAAAKVDTLLAWRNTDGRVRGTLRYHGAGTGRWTGHGPQPQNFKRDGEDVEAKLAAVATGDLARVQELYSQPLEIVGDIARAMICAPPGHRLLIGDFSGIESRVLAWASGQQSKLEQWAKFDRSANPKDEPYYLLGRSCGQPEESARKIGKTADLAFGYMGGPGAWDRLAPDDDTSSEDDKRRYQETWRRLHPQTVQFWAGINRAAIYAVNKPGTSFSCRRLTAVYNDETFLRITLPSGRSLSYPSPRLATDKFGNAMVAFKDNAAGKFVDCRYGQGAYGGLWTENIVQAISRDLLAVAMQRLEAAGYPIVLHVHDEIVAEIPIDFGSVEEFQHIITTLPEWAEGLPIAAKVRNGERFSKSERPAPAPRPNSNLNPGAEIPDDLPIPSFLLRDSPAPAAVELSAAPDELAAILTNKGDPPASQASNDQSDDHVAEDADGQKNDKAGDADDIGSAHDDAGDDGGGQDDGYASGEQSRGSCSAVYIYRDANGVPYLRVIRTAQKQFPQFHLDNSRWVKGKPKGPKIPYRLPELIAAAPDIPVFVCEGEKDADNVAALGLITTTNSEGAGKGKWTVDLNKWFAGKQTAYILEDNDEDGRRHAREVAGNLQPIVGDIRTVSFPELPVKGDVSDWLETGGTKEQLLARAKAAPRWQRDGYVLVCAADVVPRRMDWLWQGHILRGSQELLTGIPGNGKSQIHCTFAALVSTGDAWPDGCNGAPPGNVIMLTAEDCLDQTMVPRLIAAGADRNRVFILKKIRKDNKERMFLLGEDLEELERMIVQLGDVRLVTIDPITAFMGSGGKFDSHRAVDVRGQLGPLADLAERMDVALSAITHPPKHTTQRAIDHFIGSQAFIAAARIGHMTIEEVIEDEHGNKLPTGRSLFTNPKNNVSRKMSTLAYRIIEKPLDGDIKAARVTWEGFVDISADQAIAAATPARERGQQSDVVIFLMTILANGPVAVKTIEDKAAENGFSKDQLHRAKRKMGVVAFKEEGTLEGHWLWALAQHAPNKKDTDET
jgi:DNA polymerase bacteriophage-type